MLSFCTRNTVFQTICCNDGKADILYARTRFGCLRVLFINPYLSKPSKLIKAGDEFGLLLVLLCCDNRNGASRKQEVKTKSSAATAIQSAYYPTGPRAQ